VNSKTDYDSMLNDVRVVYIIVAVDFWTTLIIIHDLNIAFDSLWLVIVESRYEEKSLSRTQIDSESLLDGFSDLAISFDRY